MSSRGIPNQRNAPITKPLRPSTSSEKSFQSTHAALGPFVDYQPLFRKPRQKITGNVADTARLMEILFRLEKCNVNG
ncbi:hypothetical protein B2D07_05080 [Desulfococcus multivorans]|nr:uncharacterized protein Dmul_10460 [Desulfococcus multivorans]AQV00206.1 hypothetical protein B2D07_05080 [Desulfococcus multivorans]